MVAGGRRDYSKVAENVGLLGAQLAGYSLPIGPALGLARALWPKSSDPGAEEFVSRLMDEIERWCDDHPDRIDAIGDMPSQWRDHLVDRLAAHRPSDAASGEQLLGEALFVPLTANGRPACAALARDLAADMPNLVLRAGDPNGTISALHALQSNDIQRLERLLRHLDHDRSREADPALVSAYLTKLVGNLDHDNWSARDGAGILSLAAIQQDLALIGPQGRRLVVDEVAARAERLVILGGPGAGKTWTARRTAIRAAEVALDRLAAGDDLADIELPLFASCSQVVERSDTPRWDRLINATLAWALIDPGHAARLSHLLRSHERVVIVLDALDEAAVPQANALVELVGARPAGMSRLLVTSRPGSWNGRLLPIDPADDRHLLARLAPLTADDLRSAVAAWLADVPDVRDRLLRRLGSGSPLGRQASVPLLCAMFCLAVRPGPDTGDAHAGGDPFDLFEPGRRLDLYDTVIARLVFGAWRDSVPAPTDRTIDDAIDWLEQLAVAGKIDDPLSGLATWPDGIEPPRDPPSTIAPYVSHVAAPEPHRPPIRQTRRFIHRNLREHLTAKALFDDDPAVVAAELLPHVWFDPDWAEVIPIVIAGHPQADQLTIELARLVEDITTTDPTHALDELLARAAARTTPDPATPRRTTAIDDALTAIIDDTPFETAIEILADAPHWPSTAATRDWAFERVTSPDSTPGDVIHFGWVLHRLGATPEQADGTRERVLALLADPATPAERLEELVGRLVWLGPSPIQVQRLVDILHELLATTPAFTPDLAGALMMLDPTPDQLADLTETALDLIFSPDTDLSDVGSVARFVLGLAPDAGVTRRMAERLRALLDHRDLSPEKAYGLLYVLVRLPHDSDDALRFSDVLLSQLSTSGAHPFIADAIKEQVTRINLTPLQAGQVRDRALDLRTAPNLDFGGMYTLAYAVLRLGPTPEQAQRLAGSIVDLITAPGIHPTDAHVMMQVLAESSPSGQHVACACDRALDLIALADGEHSAGRRLAESLLGLPLTPEQSRHVTGRALELLADPDIGPEAAEGLIHVLAELETGRSQDDQIAAHLLDLLGSPQIDSAVVAPLARYLAGATRTSDTQQARSVDHLIERLAAADIDVFTAADLANAVADLNPLPELAHRAADCVIDLVPTETRPWGVEPLATVVLRLSPTRDHIQRLALALLDDLARNGRDSVTTSRHRSLGQLRRTIPFDDWSAILTRRAR